MSLEENKKIALEFLDAIKNRDMNRVKNVLADDGEFWVIGEMPLSGTHKKPRFLELIQAMIDLMEGSLPINVQRVTAEEDRVSVTGVGDMVTKSGVPYRNTYHMLMTVRNGKLLRTEEYFDTALAGRVFGG